MSRRRKRHHRAGPEAKVDMTSLIDLTFLLLVTFIVTLPALEQGISILLPQAKANELPMENKKANVITVDSLGRIFLNNKPMDAEMLEATLKQMVADDPLVPVHIRGDVRLDYGSVMNVVKIVYKCKVVKMALVTVEE